MSRKDTQDIIGGVALAALGVFAAVYAQRYEFGDVQRMGAGYFPVVLGIILTVLGILIALPAFFRRGDAIRGEWKNLFFVIASVVVFALTLKLLGLILATVVSVVVSLIPEQETRLKGSLLVAAGISLLTYLIFSLGLGMVLPVWPWSP